MTVRHPTGAVATLTLTGLAALHAYWARGGRWPGVDAASLGETVVGPGAKLPPAPAVWAVASLLAGSAAAMATTMTGRGPRRLALKMTWATGGVLLARGAIGLPLSLVRGLDTRFGRLDASIYSPLCLALGAASVLVARGAATGAHRTRGGRS